MNPKDEAEATEAEQKVEKIWDSSDIEFLVQACPKDCSNLWTLQLWEPVGSLYFMCEYVTEYFKHADK